MAATTPNTILLQVNGDEKPVFERQVATAVVTPGDLLELLSAGTVQAVATAGKINQRMFALENLYASDPTLLSLNQTYAVGDNARYIYGQNGDLVYARLAASQTVSAGDILGPSTTAGCLQKVATVDATVIAGSPVGTAEEAVTTTGSTGRIRVRLF